MQNVLNLLKEQVSSYTEGNINEVSLTLARLGKIFMELSNETTRFAMASIMWDLVDFEPLGFLTWVGFGFFNLRFSGLWALGF